MLHSPFARVLCEIWIITEVISLVNHQNIIGIIRDVLFALNAVPLLMSNHSCLYQLLRGAIFYTTVSLL